MVKLFSHVKPFEGYRDRVAYILLDSFESHDRIRSKDQLYRKIYSPLSHSLQIKPKNKIHRHDRLTILFLL